MIKLKVVKPAPVAVMVVVAPGQINCNGVTANGGGAITDISTEKFAIQPRALVTVKLIVGLWC